MLRKKECLAMLLAGGQGSRLYTLTKKVAKPAVYFGSKYRIIDFPLSNCINSDIDTVRQWEIYNPILASKINSRLRNLFGKSIKSASLTACKQHSQTLFLS